MGTITEKLQAILNSKQAIKQAIVDKGVSISDTEPLSGYANKIGQISGGDITSTSTAIKSPSMVSINQIASDNTITNSSIAERS